MFKNITRMGYVSFKIKYKILFSSKFFVILYLQNGLNIIVIISFNCELLCR